MTPVCKRPNSSTRGDREKNKVQGRRLCQFAVTIAIEFEWRRQEQAKLQLTINRTEHSITWVARR